MAVLPIKTLNDPVLRTKCAAVAAVTDDIRKLITDMKETMQQANGVGLAAPQVGVGKCVIVVAAGTQGALGLVNPQITKRSRERGVEEEGCLSFPGLFLEIKRAQNVTVEALNEQGKPVTFEAEGLLARVLQHEIDHINGVLFFQRLPWWRKLAFKFKHPGIT